MKTEKQIGIWMDHEIAHLMTFTNNNPETTIIESKFTHAVKERSLHNGENSMHKKEQHEQTEYYKTLGDKIKQYDSVLLFGATDAKTELFNILKADHLFEKIKIEVKQADKMTKNQQYAFVRKHFSGR